MSSNSVDRAVAVAARVSYPTDDKCLSVRRVPLLGEHSSVRLVDVGGYNLSRVTTHEGTEKLITFLAREQHGSPFEMVDFVFYIEGCPVVLAAQWMRHRIGSFNVESARYKKPRARFYLPSRWSRNATSNLQGAVFFEGDDAPTDGDLELRAAMEAHYANAWSLYERLVSAGVSREQARFALPQAALTDFYWKVNARSLANFLSLRLGSNAQLEMQAFAHAVKECAQVVAPNTIEELLKHV